MGRNIGGQAYGNAAGTVHQQVGEASRQHIRLFQRIVKVQPERHGITVNIPKHLQCQGRHTCFRVTHGSGTVAINGAEVAVTVHQLPTHGKVLRHAHQSIIYAGISMGVILTQAVTHNTGTLPVRLVRGGAKLHHGV